MSELNQEVTLKEHQHALDWQLENFRAVFQFATLAIKSMQIINGGALIALLTLVGNVWTSRPEEAKVIAHQLDMSWLLFLLGLSSSVLSAVLGYQCQTNIAFTGHEKLGEIYRFVGIIAILFSLGFFFGGAYLALKSLAE